MTKIPLFKGIYLSALGYFGRYGVQPGLNSTWRKLNSSLASILEERTSEACSGPLRILVVDDHHVMREGLSLRIETEPHMKVIGSVATGVDAIAAARRLHPDVIIMDLVLPLLNGIDATRHIVCEAPHTHIVALSACRSLEHVRRMLRAGAHAYVLKSAGGNELTEAIKTVAAGHLYLSHELVALYGDKVLTAGPVNPIESLSDRERQVLRGLVAGLTSAEIGRRFSLSCKTVESYRCRMMMKLGISDRSALIRLAREYDLPEA